MKSQPLKHSIIIAGHKTSVSLEDAFWNGLKEIADNREMTLTELVTEIKSARKGNLSLFVLRFYRDHLYGTEQRGHHAVDGTHAHGGVTVTLRADKFGIMNASNR